MDYGSAHRSYQRHLAADFGSAVNTDIAGYDSVTKFYNLHLVKNSHRNTFPYHLFIYCLLLLLLLLSLLLLSKLRLAVLIE